MLLLSLLLLQRGREKCFGLYASVTCHLHHSTGFKTFVSDMTSTLIGLTLNDARHTSSCCATH